MKWYYSKWVGGPKLLTLVQAQVWWLPKNEEIMVKLMASDGSAAQWTIGDWLHWTNAYNASTKWKPKCCECARKLAKCCGLCPNTLLLDATHAMSKLVGGLLLPYSSVFLPCSVRQSQRGSVLLYSSVSSSFFLFSPVGPIFTYGRSVGGCCLP